MARVVQRRGTPPYLLILFVFLFVISTVLAVLFYVQYSDKTKLLDEADAELSKANEDLDKAKNKDIPDLAKAITGRMVPADPAMKEAEQAFTLEHAKEFSNLGLIQAVKGLDAKIDELAKEIKRLEGRERVLSDTIAKKDRSLATLKSDYEGKLVGLRRQLTSAQSAFTQALAAKDAQLQRATKEKDASIAQLEQRITVLTQEKDDLLIEIQKRDARIRQLEEKIREILGRPKVGPWVLRKADGNIAKVLPDQNIVYISLGRQSNVKPGLPFSVYAREKSIPEDGEPKAKIIVVNVGPTTSECRITEPAKEDPIAEGDLVANVVFDTSRVHKFVIDGEFDLYGEGRPDPLGKRRVRALVESFGGKVTEMVSVDTDIVIMGDEPPRPPQPAANAPASDWQLYNDKMKKYNHYKEIKASALSLQVPILNTTRFLAFSGYVPKKRLSD